MISNLVIALGLYAILGKAFPQPQVDQFWVNDDSSVEESYEIAVLNSENYKTNPFTGLDVDGGVDPEPVHVEETLISYEGGYIPSDIYGVEQLQQQSDPVYVEVPEENVALSIDFNEFNNLNLPLEQQQQPGINDIGFVPSSPFDGNQISNPFEVTKIPSDERQDCVPKHPDMTPHCCTYPTDTVIEDKSDTDRHCVKWLKGQSDCPNEYTKWCCRERTLGEILHPSGLICTSYPTINTLPIQGV